MARRTVGPVTEEIMVEIAKLHSENPGEEIIFLLATKLHDRYPSKTIVDAHFRMMALANFLEMNKGEPWTIRPPGETYTLVNEALYRAAASLPLSYDPDGRDDAMHFDEQELMKRTLSISDIDGNA